jgi:choline dehydrogenase-like flavoprotein
MKIIRTEIEINAPLSLVWQLVVDLAGYNVWNPFLTYVRGEAKEGASVEFHVNLPGAQTTPTRVRISQILPGSKIVWVGHFLNIPGLIDGEHGLEFIQLGPAQTKVIHWENFRGWLLPLLGSFTAHHVLRGMEIMNPALKWRAEHLHSEIPEEGRSMSVQTADPKELEKVHWDAILVGTGMGGATLGHALAAGGQRVLFLEKGEDYLSNPNALCSNFMEVLAKDSPATPLNEETAMNSGRWWGEIYDAAQNRFVRPILGIGTGGSSALYGMVMERFFPADFEPRRFHRGETKSTLPERWPIQYEQLLPYYARAEALYKVESREGPDPLRGETPVGRGTATVPRHMATRIFEQIMRAKKLHINTLPLACEWKNDCRFCHSWLCDKDCKNDAARMCLRPAVKRHGAALLTRFSVDRLAADRNFVTAVHGCWKDGRAFRFHGKRVFLAAGALASPRILLRSKSEDWPLGLANRSGAVGRNLMRQLNDVYTLPSVWNFEKTPSFTMKETGWNDFYVVNGVKYGTVQSWGKSPPGFMLMEDFLFRVRQTFPPWVSSALSFFRPMAVVLLDALFVRSGFVGTMMEDLPHWDNELASLPPGPDGRERIAVHYRISPYDRSRLRRFRRMVGRALFPFPFLRLKTADTWKFVGHACGTVRFGDDPATSVLNAVNRAHDVKNLYVVDASFFPSSGGINPALTIAANALRVADHILKDNPDFLPEA